MLITKVWRDTSKLASSETQGRSVGSGKTAAKVLKKARESPRDATLNDPVPQLIRMLVPLWYLHKSKHTDLTYGVLSWHASADTVLMLQTKTSKLILEIPIKKGYLKEDIYFLLLLLFFLWDVNECIRMPCKNGGSCFNKPGSFECICRKGYQGKLCEKGKAEVFTMFQKYVVVFRFPTTRREYRVAHPFLSFILVQKLRSNSHKVLVLNLLWHGLIISKTLKYLVLRTGRG